MPVKLSFASQMVWNWFFFIAIFPAKVISCWENEQRCQKKREEYIRRKLFVSHASSFSPTESLWLFVLRSPWIVARPQANYWRIKKRFFPLTRRENRNKPFACEAMCRPQIQAECRKVAALLAIHKHRLRISYHANKSRDEKESRPGANFSRCKNLNSHSYVMREKKTFVLDRRIGRADKYARARNN